MKLESGTKVFLDLKNYSNRNKLEAYLKKLEVAIEEFLSNEIDYVVTNRKLDSATAPPKLHHRNTSFSSQAFPANTPKVMMMSRGQTLLMRSNSTNSLNSQSFVDPIHFAMKFNIPIVDILLLKKVLKSAMAKLKSSQKLKSSNKLCKKLGNEFIKIEDVSQRFSPIFRCFQNLPKIGEKKSTETKVANKKKGVDVKLTYCECCEEVVNSLSVHNNDKKHVTFSQKSENYLLLDQMISDLPSLHDLPLLHLNNQHLTNAAAESNKYHNDNYGDECYDIEQKKSKAGLPCIQSRRNSHRIIAFENVECSLSAMDELTHPKDAQHSLDGVGLVSLGCHDNSNAVNTNKVLIENNLIDKIQQVDTDRDLNDVTKSFLVDKLISSDFSCPEEVVKVKIPGSPSSHDAEPKTDETVVLETHLVDEKSLGDCLKLVINLKEVNVTGPTSITTLSETSLNESNELLTCGNSACFSPVDTKSTNVKLDEITEPNESSADRISNGAIMKYTNNQINHNKINSNSDSNEISKKFLNNDIEGLNDLHQNGEEPVNQYFSNNLFPQSPYCLADTDRRNEIVPTNHIFSSDYNSYSYPNCTPTQQMLLFQNEQIKPFQEEILYEHTQHLQEKYLKHQQFLEQVKQQIFTPTMNYLPNIMNLPEAFNASSMPCYDAYSNLFWPLHFVSPNIACNHSFDGYPPSPQNNAQLGDVVGSLLTTDRKCLTDETIRPQQFGGRRCVTGKRRCDKNKSLDSQLFNVKKSLLFNKRNNRNFHDKTLKNEDHDGRCSTAKLEDEFENQCDIEINTTSSSGRVCGNGRGLKCKTTGHNKNCSSTVSRENVFIESSEVRDRGDDSGTEIYDVSLWCMSYRSDLKVVFKKIGSSSHYDTDDLIK
ncbi:hypothetical protein HELRODRAFT_166157 [Helobdella robusta]|uniref:DBF4-type domain-containing protein n=1 Tax=Helobdella robusta TaxID=6412 RepID=T1EXU8_HELRO|nr:hypothetical protein HELRODRAFT_166157 [Helobdella robusta]ESN90488.1 hypothetical protein HELRODRAFT_166157 [Helobdella robusta]